MTDIVPSFQNVFDGILRNVSRRFEELKTALHDNISSDIGKPGFTLSSIHSDIPGFRTGKLWKMILAFFGYLSFLYCSMTSDFTNAKNGLPLTGLQLWHERFFSISDAAQPYFFIILTTKKYPNQIFSGSFSPFCTSNCSAVSDFFGDFGHSYGLYATDRRNHMVGSLSLTVKIYAVSETFLYEYLLLLLLFI